MRKTSLFLSFLFLITVVLSACFNSPRAESVLSQAESIFQSIDNSSQITSQVTSQVTSRVTSEATSKVSVSIMAKLNYTAFGDSIARGAGLVNPETNCYPAIVLTKLKALQSVEQIKYQNFAIDGQTSPQLLEQLKTKGDVIAKSDIITISTGANNILGVFLAQAAKIFDKYGFAMNDVLNVGSIFSDIFSGAPDPTTYQKLLQIFTELNNYIESDEYDVQIATAAAQLRSDLPKIVAEIRSRNKDAIIIVNTIYNPYKHLAIKMGNISLFSPADETENAVVALNQVINEEQKKLGYIIAPVYEGFNAYKGNERLENAYFSFESLRATNIDVHPSIAGHKLIADIVYETIFQTIIKSS